MFNLLQHEIEVEAKKMQFMDEVLEFNAKKSIMSVEEREAELTRLQNEQITLSDLRSNVNIEELLSSRRRMQETFFSTPATVDASLPPYDPETTLQMVPKPYVSFVDPRKDLGSGIYGYLPRKQV